MKLKFGWTANDWFWRFAALSCLVILPVFVFFVWKHGRRYGFWKTTGGILKDIGLTLVYGNYDNAKL